MSKEKEMTTMWVRKTQKDTIQKLKKHKNQADYEVLDVLLEAYDRVQARASVEGEPQT